MSTINNPDIDPANNYSLVGAITYAFQKMQQAVNGMLPAKVLSYDRVANRVSVQLLINITTTGGQSISRAQLSSIPVLCLGGGNYSVSFPLTAGSLGWVLVSDRDISSFLSSYEQADPSTTRVSNFADSVFFPDVMKTYNITDANKDYLIIQSNDGTMSIEMGINPSTNKHEINVKAERVVFDLGDPLSVFGVNGTIYATGAINPSTPIPP